MSIASQADYASALKQVVQYTIVAAAGTTVATRWMSAWVKASGVPGSGASPGSTTAGVVPTDQTTGAPNIVDFSGVGYISNIEYCIDTAAQSNWILYDRLWHAGIYNFNDSINLSAQPSFSSRIPGGTDYSGTELWFESVTAFTGTPTITVTYTNQAGTAGQSTALTPVLAVGSTTVGFRIPLAAGDTGIQKVESVVATIASVGTFNLFIARPLWQRRMEIYNTMQVDGWSQTGMPVVYQDSCLCWLVCTDGAVVPKISANVEIASK